MADDDIDRAASAIRAADALLVTAGAGMGVDSGLPDFRGNEGFWNAYPPYKKLGVEFSQMANPRWFDTDPAFAWGFYGHRLALYRKTTPHAGFGLLRAWGSRAKLGAFVFTSNVDGAFQRAGFDPERIVECHGAIDWVQCVKECGAGITSADRFDIGIDEDTLRAREPLPACGRCGGLLRPNILMFGDFGWDSARTEKQEDRFERWLADIASDKAKLVIVECGAGTAIPTVRMVGERLTWRIDSTLVRINVREPEVPNGQLGIAAGALAALRAIDEKLSRVP
jgi:NAD-dependent SIR2 family protein deacetylase